MIHLCLWLSTVTCIAKTSMTDYQLWLALPKHLCLWLSTVICIAKTSMTDYWLWFALPTHLCLWLSTKWNSAWFVIKRKLLVRSYSFQFRRKLKSCAVSVPRNSIFSIVLTIKKKLNCILFGWKQTNTWNSIINRIRNVFLCV